jgi:hypothetical protein
MEKFVLLGSRLTESKIEFKALRRGIWNRRAADVAAIEYMVMKVLRNPRHLVMLLLNPSQFKLTW